MPEDNDIWRRPISDVDFVVFDFETTGLDPYKGHAIVEFGAMKISGGGPVGHFLELANPGRSIPSEAYAVHGIADDDVRAAPPVAELLPGFLDFIADSALIAQNAAFDMSFLAAAHNDELPLGNPALDLIGLTKHFVPGLSSNALGSVCRALGVRNVAAHRAMGDVAATTQIFLVYYEELLGQNPDATLADLFRISHADDEIDAAFANYLKWAIAYRRDVDVSYKKTARAEPQIRKLKPLRIFNAKKKAVSYLKAVDLYKKEERTFKLSNLSARPEN
ncbi:MAG: hypothetical protein GY771_10525 [bacterium]|nr:hypothetical protein [bacterium]